MGIRSDVFVALKKELVEKLPEKYDKMLREEYRAEVLEHAEGRAYFMEYVKWYAHNDAELVEFYEWLDGNEAMDQHLVIEACHDFPESTDGDAGDWNNNPWGACRYVRAGIEFDRNPKSKEASP